MNECHQIDIKHLTLHTTLYPVDQLVGLAAVQQSPDGRKGVQDDGLRVGVNVVLKHRDTNISHKQLTVKKALRFINNRNDGDMRVCY